MIRYKSPRPRLSITPAIGFSIVTFFAIQLWAAPPEQNIPPSPDPQNIEGTWFKPLLAETLTHDAVGDALYKGDEDSNPSFTPKGKAIWDKRQAARAARMPLPDPMAKCAPAGVPRMLEGNRKLTQFIATPGKLTMLMEDYHAVRTIYIDGKHPEHPIPSFMGHSTGHWDGDTLVVDTVAQRPENLITRRQFPTSENTHVVERFRKIDGGQKLENVWTIEDPTLYTAPWTGRIEYLWHPGEDIGEFVCEESQHIEPSKNAGSYH